MKDYAIYYRGKWRDGHMHVMEDHLHASGDDNDDFVHAAENMTLIVRCDGENMAYTIERCDYDDFVEWVAVHWNIDRWSEQGDDQETISWLEENGCRVEKFYHL